MFICDVCGYGYRCAGHPNAAPDTYDGVCNECAAQLAKLRGEEPDTAYDAPPDDPDTLAEEPPGFELRRTPAPKREGEER